MKDYPENLAIQAERKRRAAMLYAAHMLPLTKFVEEMRKEKKLNREIPFFDSLDGGINAQILFLLEEPGPQALESGFISRNNPDLTAKNSLELHQEVKLNRAKTALWNIIPWYLGKRSIKTNDINQGLNYLVKLIPLFKNLKAIALVGRTAQHINVISFLLSDYHYLRLFLCPHPSKKNFRNSSKN